MKRLPTLLTKIFLGAIISGNIFPSLAEESLTSSTNLALKQISPDVFQLGSVQLNKEKKTIQFPATVNMTNGVVEYFIVNGIGKLHESVLKTDVAPSQIHVAMLFLGAQVATNATTNILSGNDFTIDVSWKNGGLEKKLRGEELVFNTETKSPMSKGMWIYNGSKIINGTFIAERDGSIVSIMTDALALANNPRPGRENDENWLVNSNSVPPLNTKVDVTFRLESPQKSTKVTK
jgi:hypothetical protein